MATVTAREFNHDVSSAKRAAAEGPVIITDHGRPSHVLLSIDDYERMVGAPRDLASWLTMDSDIVLDTELAPNLTIALNVPDL